MKKKDPNQFWLKPDVEVEHRITKQRFIVLQVIRGRYKHLHSGAMYSRVFGVLCKDLIGTRSIMFHTQELVKPAPPKNP